MSFFLCFTQSKWNLLSSYKFFNLNLFRSFSERVETMPKPEAVSHWSAVLRLSMKWQFDSVQVLAQSELGKCMDSPVDRIAIGLELDLEKEWFTKAYSELCCRPAPLTAEEGEKLGMDATIRISAARHEHWRNKRSAPTVPGTVVDMCFPAKRRRVTDASSDSSSS